MRSLHRRLGLTACAFALLAPGVTLAQVHDRSVLPRQFKMMPGLDDAPAFTSRSGG